LTSVTKYNQGTNLGEFIKEAHRIVRPGTGILKIVEVRSRFATEDGNNHEGLMGFKKFLSKSGFDVKEQRVDGLSIKEVKSNHKKGGSQRHTDDNKMFFMLECRKNHKKPIFGDYSAKACLYKRR
jgi:hypothetical protein